MKMKNKEQKKNNFICIDFNNEKIQERNDRKKIQIKPKSLSISHRNENLHKEKLPKKVFPDDLPHEPTQKLDYKPKESEIQGKDTAQIEEIIEPKEVPISELPHIKPKEASIEELEQEIKLKKKLLKQQKKEEKIKAKFEKQLKKQIKKKQIEIPQEEQSFSQIQDTSKIKEIKLIPLGCQIIKVCPICNKKIKRNKIRRMNNVLMQTIRCKACEYMRELKFEV